MDIKPLQLFLTLTETLHFGQCSQRCHVSASTLSRTIQQLEEELGTTLFLRDNRSVELTPAGERFQAYAQEAIDQWAAIRLTLQDEATALQGDLSVYCSVTASHSFLHKILKSFRKTCPSVEIKLHTGDPEGGIKRVQNGQEDIAMAACPPQLPDGLAFQPVGRTPLVLIGPNGSLSEHDRDYDRDHDHDHEEDGRRHTDAPAIQTAIAKPAAPQTHCRQGNSEPIKQLLAQAPPMILPERGVSRDLINEWLFKLKLTPNIYAQAAGNEAIVSMVSLGFGLGIVPEIVLRNSLLVHQIELLGPLEAFSEHPLPPYQVGLFTQSKRLAHPIIRAFWQQVST
jgi:LysR family positive regulator for ilvC